MTAELNCRPYPVQGRIPQLAHDATARRAPKRPPVYHADHIEIPLTKGLVAIVDIDCPPEILARNWCSRAGYAAGGPLGKPILLHRELLGLAAGSDLHVDHIDGDRLNNRRSNLRTCTNRQNMANLRPRGGTSRFRGVSWHKATQKWVAMLSWKADGKGHAKYVGTFTDEEQAARAWDRAASASGLYDPDYLRLNFPAEVSA